MEGGFGIPDVFWPAESREHSDAIGVMEKGWSGDMFLNLWNSSGDMFEIVEYWVDEGCLTGGSYCRNKVVPN